MHYAKRSFVVLFALSLRLIAEVTPEPTALWEFDSAITPLRATVGEDLVLQGSHEAAQGVVDGDGAFSVGVGSHYRAKHGIPVVPGQKRVNAYTLAIDFKTPVDRDSHSLFQTNPENSDPSEVDTKNREGVIGASFVGWSPQFSFTPGEWYRFILAADLEAGRYDLYLNGECVLRGAPQDINRNYSLDPESVLFFADNDGGDKPITVSRIAIYDRALTDAEVEVIAFIKPAAPNNTAPEFAGKAARTTAKAGAPVTLALPVRDAEGDRLRYRLLDRNGQPLTLWSALLPSSEPIAHAHTFNLPGTVGVSIELKDEYGARRAPVHCAEIAVAGSSTAEILTAPYFMNVKPMGITVMWETNEPLSGAFSIEGGEKFEVAAEPSGFGTYIYRAVATGLQADTSYAASVELESEGYYEVRKIAFATAPVEARPFVFGVWSDSQGHNKGSYSADPYEPTNSMLRHMGASDAAFGVACGDMAEDGGGYDDTRKFYLDRVAKHLGTQKPFFVAWGNHDDYRGSALRKFGSFPSEDVPGYEAGYGSYSFDYAGCHFVCIDYATQYPDVFHWLEQDLKANQHAKFTFLFIHEPPYCELWIDGESTLRSQLVPLMERYGVDACFSGHTHEYERGYKNGVYYCITGGGSWLDHGEPVVKDWPHMTVGGAQNLKGYTAGLVNQYVRVKVGEDSWEAESIAFQPDGKEIGVVDRFSSDEQPSPSEHTLKPVTHTVYFWLSHELTDVQIEEFKKGLESLRAIDGVVSLTYGAPLAGDRPVIDDSYTLGMTIVLRDEAALRSYLPDPIHEKFLADFGGYWTKARVLDYR